MNYKVVVITPCYNIFDFKSQRENLFDENIKSIQNQTINYENIEHILIDDGSSDDTREHLLKISKDVPNMKIFTIDKNTGGPAIPRNIGINNTSAKYIFFLDADDNLEPTALETMYNEIKKKILI